VISPQTAGSTLLYYHVSITANAACSLHYSICVDPADCTAWRVCLCMLHDVVLALSLYIPRSSFSSPAWTALHAIPTRKRWYKLCLLAHKFSSHFLFMFYSIVTLFIDSLQLNFLFEIICCNYFGRIYGRVNAQGQAQFDVPPKSSLHSSISGDFVVLIILATRLPLESTWSSEDAVHLDWCATTNQAWLQLIAVASATVTAYRQHYCLISACSQITNITWPTFSKAMYIVRISSMPT